jgi:hypothetical protein
MTSFIDLVGASGATYRFHAWSEAGQTPMAGNFVAVERQAQAVRVLMAGMTNDLSKVPTMAGEGVRPDALFVRRNVARHARSSEHGDLVARHSPATIYAPD